jgi:hypothetical protein
MSGRHCGKKPNSVISENWHYCCLETARNSATILRFGERRKCANLLKFVVRNWFAENAPYRIQTIESSGWRRRKSGDSGLSMRSFFNLGKAMVQAQRGTLRKQRPTKARTFKLPLG